MIFANIAYWLGFVGMILAAILFRKGKVESAYFVMNGVALLYMGLGWRLMQFIEKLR